MTGDLDDTAAFTETVREVIALFDARDRERRRFGARRHQYRLRPPIAPARLDAIARDADVRFPDDYRAHVTTLGDGGAGPYHGVLPLDHPVQHALLGGGFDPGDARHGVVGVGHLGCGYLALLVVDPAHAAHGQVWIDARGAGAGVKAAYPTFRHYVADWITRLAHAEWLESFVPADACALPNALSSYFHAVEQRRGLPEGSLAGDDLRDALGDIGPGGIVTTHDGTTPFFAAGDPVDLCVACERLAENLGLNPAAIAPGVEPIPAR